MRRITQWQKVKLYASEGRATGTAGKRAKFAWSASSNSTSKSSEKDNTDSLGKEKPAFFCFCLGSRQGRDVSPQALLHSLQKEKKIIKTL